MVEAALSPPITRQAMQPDLRPLYSALSRTTDMLDALEICEATAMAYGGGLWLAACWQPVSVTYACGGFPVAEACLQEVLKDMAQTLRAREGSARPQLSQAVVARWRDPTPESAERLPSEYAQIELCAAGATCGVLRVIRDSDQRADGCDWEAIEGIMCAASSSLVLNLHLASASSGVDPITGLCNHAEMLARVEREVDAARVHPTELALLLVELRIGRGRLRRPITDEQLRAVGEVLRGTLRRTDSAGRLQDGRLAALLPVTSQRNALIVAERLTRLLTQHPLLGEDLQVQVGVSGWAFEGPSAPELFEQAGQALESAQRAGARGAFVFL